MTHIEALIKPYMLKWIREKSGFDLSKAAEKIGVNPGRLNEWEEGSKKPTIKQAIKMAEIYKRPLSLFYLNEPPKDFQIAMKDFRTLPPGLPGIYSPALLLELRSAASRRNIVVDLVDDSNSGNFPLLGNISLDRDPEQIGKNIRELLNINWHIQQKWKTQGEALNWWRESIENLNVLVFHTNHQGHTVELEEARGFSINEKQFPVIMLNSKDSNAGRIFTLIHELVHLMLNNGGVCDCLERAISGPISGVEMFCNRAAGAILVPSEILKKHEVVKKHGGGKQWKDEEIETLSSDFSVSNETLLRRLLIFGLTSERFYQSKREEYSERWAKIKIERQNKSHPPYDRLKLRQLGKPFARAVFAAYYDRKITLSDVMDYIGVKSGILKKMEVAAYSTAMGS
ncbi:MAG: XRE family transcriptional regulator [Acidobacteria bacterium]|jgi:Zn-dependent peptidase ImmA (M78 family)/transcriptional regulator with XRE-family HTH domain|nr:XRE family transcriptional regulator [Acidobacteriota bacterium]